MCPPRRQLSLSYGFALLVGFQTTLQPKLPARVFVSETLKRQRIVTANDTVANPLVRLRRGAWTPVHQPLSNAQLPDSPLI